MRSLIEDKRKRAGPFAVLGEELEAIDEGVTQPGCQRDPPRPPGADKKIRQDRYDPDMLREAERFTLEPHILIGLKKKIGTQVCYEKRQEQRARSRDELR
jgi:hypothetical protein